MRQKPSWAVTAMLLLASFAPALADLPGRHPYYLHALSDLRGARWLLGHRPGDASVSAHEDIAIQAIDAAIREIQHAAITDGKGLRDHPPMDLPPERGGRLHRAADLLRRVHTEIAREEDDPQSRGLRNRAIQHVDEAINQADRAVFDMEHHR